MRALCLVALTGQARPNLEPEGLDETPEEERAWCDCATDLRIVLLEGPFGGMLCDGLTHPGVVGLVLVVFRKPVEHSCHGAAAINIKLPRIIEVLVGFPLRPCSRLGWVERWCDWPSQ